MHPFGLSKTKSLVNTLFARLFLLNKYVTHMSYTKKSPPANKQILSADGAIFTISESTFFEIFHQINIKFTNIKTLDILSE